MKKLNCARIIDQWSWCYDFISKEHQRYSRHNIHVFKYNDVKYDNLDLVYCHSPNISHWHIKNLVQECRERKIKLIGGYAGDPNYWEDNIRNTYSFVNLVVGISPETVKFGKENYQTPTIFMPELIDTKYFKTRRKKSKSFIIGWAGGKHKKIKRVHLLDEIKFKVIKKSDFNKVRFAKSKNQNDMLKFYNHIDVLTMTSETECQPRVVLEAMAMGIPVVSTKVGNIPMLLDESFTVSTYPEEVLIKEMNHVLEKLKNDSELYHKNSKRNEEWIREYFSWENKCHLWDDLFEAVYNEDTKSAINISNSFLDDIGFHSLYE